MEDGTGTPENESLHRLGEDTQVREWEKTSKRRSILRIGSPLVGSPVLEAEHLAVVYDRSIYQDSPVVDDLAFQWDLRSLPAMLSVRILRSSASMPSLGTTMPLSIMLPILPLLTIMPFGWRLSLDLGLTDEDSLSGLPLISTLSPGWYNGSTFGRLLLSRSPYTYAEAACYMAARLNNQWQLLESFKDQWYHIDAYQRLVRRTSIAAQVQCQYWPKWLEYGHASDYGNEVRIRPTVYESISNNILDEAGPLYTHRARPMVVIVIYRASHAFIHINQEIHKRADDPWTSCEGLSRLERSWAQLSRVAHPRVKAYSASRPTRGIHLERLFV